MILVGVAVIIVWWNRDKMFSRVGAVTAVIPAAKPFATKAAA